MKLHGFWERFLWCLVCAAGVSRVDCLTTYVAAESFVDGRASFEVAAEAAQLADYCIVTLRERVGK